MVDPDTTYTSERVHRIALDLSTRMKMPHLYEEDFDDEPEERLPPSPEALRQARY